MRCNGEVKEMNDVRRPESVAPLFIIHSHFTDASSLVMFVSGGISTNDAHKWSCWAVCEVIVICSLYKIYFRESADFRRP